MFDDVYKYSSLSEVDISQMVVISSDSALDFDLWPLDVSSTFRHRIQFNYVKVTVRRLTFIETSSALDNVENKHF